MLWFLSQLAKKKKLFWTNKKFGVFFNCSNWEKFVEQIGDANCWKHLMYSLYIRNLCMAIFMTPRFYFVEFRLKWQQQKYMVRKELTCTFIDKFAFGLRSVWGRYVKLDSYILAFLILDANVCASNSRYRTIFKSKISGNRIQIWVGNYQLNHV